MYNEIFNVHHKSMHNKHLMYIITLFNLQYYKSNVRHKTSKMYHNLYNMLYASRLIIYTSRAVQYTCGS
jgi:hypothetical protein